MSKVSDEMGVQPDEVQASEVTQEIVHEPLPVRHDYVQYGSIVECCSCPLRHGIDIGPDKILTKDEKGEYKLEKRRFV